MPSHFIISAMISATASAKESESGRIGRDLNDASELSDFSVRRCACFVMTYAIDVNTSMYGPSTAATEALFNVSRAKK